jgi:hypothetical protein
MVSKLRCVLSLLCRLVYLDRAQKQVPPSRHIGTLRTALKTVGIWPKIFVQGFHMSDETKSRTGFI